MSDFCSGCSYHPKKTCPLTPLYWAYLRRHSAALEGNPRMAIPLSSASRRSAARCAEDEATFAAWRSGA